MQGAERGSAWANFPGQCEVCSSRVHVGPARPAFCAACPLGQPLQPRCPRSGASVRPRAAGHRGTTPPPAPSRGHSQPQPAFPFNARARQGPRVPSLESPRRPRFPSPFPGPCRPFNVGRPSPTPPPSCPAAGLGCHFTFPRHRPAPPWPAGGAATPARAAAPPPPLAVARREEEGGADRGGGGRGGRRARRGRRGARALAVSPGQARGHAHWRARARGRPGGGGGSWRRRLHFPGLRGDHRSSVWGAAASGAGAGTAGGGGGGAEGESGRARPRRGQAWPGGPVRGPALGD